MGLVISGTQRLKEELCKGHRAGAGGKKYIEETENYRNFVRLCDEIIQVNERIADLRPVPEVKDTAELERLKKTYRYSSGRN